MSNLYVHIKEWWQKYVKKLNLCSISHNRGIRPFLVCYINPYHVWMYYQIQYVPLRPVTCQKFYFRNKNSLNFPHPYLYNVLCFCSHVMLIRFCLRTEEKQLEWGRTAVQAAGPGLGRGFWSCRLSASHAFELVDALFGIAWPDLSEGLVLVASRFHVLCVDHIVHRLLGLVAGVGQLRAQSLGKKKKKYKKHWKQKNILINLEGVFFSHELEWCSKRIWNTCVIKIKTLFWHKKSLLNHGHLNKCLEMILIAFGTEKCTFCYTQMLFLSKKWSFW